MPGLLNPPASSACSPLAVSSNAIWSKRRDEITFDQLQKFWNELPPHARQELLRIDKQTLFEQARKNLYCSRCNGLLLEGFSQIVMYGKSLQQEGSGFHLPNRTGVASKTYIDNEIDDAKDPSVHPWGGLAATRDGLLTLLDCFINARSLKALQNVFDSARARERERELLYPDACGGGGRGWISQGMTNYGRGHGTRETCALHTARLSCDTLVDFWSALSEETRTSLLRMKEEDFMERLMYRDCRRNVIREFKELKELKRMRRELCCTSWFCVADTDFQYEVSEDTIQADWHQTFADTAYNRFEWAIGTAEGKYDILEYEDVGMNLQVQMNGLDLGGLSACYISLRAFKSDGRCNELCVKAHALKGQPCVHRRLIIGDGSVMITKGESIRRFFEHAEEAEEEEDEDGIDKDGNEIDGDGSRPQKHAKSPELAREFLLDAATVIFKEQVEKAFREGTARQNAHSIFVSLALKLLEERVHVACKEIITLEKQIKLLEEEEKEKREEEERRERRKVKEREKKLRRKERLKGKERERERKNNSELDSLNVALSTSANDLPSSTHEVSSPTTVDSGDSISDPGDVITPERPISPDIKDEQYDTNSLKNDDIRHQCHVDEDFIMRDNNGSFTLEQSKSSRRKLRLKKDSLLGQASKWYEGSAHHDKFSNTRLMAPSWMNGGHKPLRERVVKVNPRNCNPKYSEKYQCSSSRMRDRYDFQSCSCSQTGDHRPKDGYHISTLRSVREIKTANKQEPAFYRGNKYSHGCFIQDNCALPKGKLSAIPRQVWEPLDARRKNNRLNSDSDPNSGAAVDNNQSEEINNSGISENLSKTDTQNTSCSEFVAVTKSDCYSEDGALGNSCGDPIINSSSSDNCSPCISEGDSNTSSSGTQITDSSSTSDSEDTPPISEEREDSCFTMKATEFEPTFFSPNTDNGAGFGYNLPPQRPCMPPMNNHSMHIPVFSSPGIGYQNPNPVSWQPSGPSGLMTFPQSNHFVCSPSPFNYSLPPPRSSSEFGMHYDPLQTVTTPLFTPRYHSFYQANNRVYVPKPKEQINNFGVAATIVSVSPAKTQFRERQITSKPPSDEPSKPFDDNPCFSLFHFGGPVAGAAGFNVNSDSLKEDTSGRLAPKSAGSLQADSTCSKEDTTIEEYSLFKTGNGARFSFF